MPHRRLAVTIFSSWLSGYLITQPRDVHWFHISRNAIAREREAGRPRDFDFGLECDGTDLTHDGEEAGLWVSMAVFQPEGPEAINGTKSDMIGP